MEVVQDAVAGERDPIDPFRQVRVELGDVVGDRLGMAVADPLEHRSVELHLALFLVNRLEAHVDVGAAVVGDEGQSRVETGLVDELGEVARAPVDLDVRRGKAVRGERDDGAFSFLEDVEDAELRHAPGGHREMHHHGLLVQRFGRGAVEDLGRGLPELGEVHPGDPADEGTDREPLVGRRVQGEREVNPTRGRRDHDAEPSGGQV